MGLSVAIITQNEEANLRKTLESVRWADEIVLVDSGSTDNTLNIARGYDSRIIHQNWLGFSEQKNLAISQCTQKWVLSLDADEQVDSNLEQEIRRVIHEPDSYEAFFVNRKNYFLGKWIKHGGFYPDRKLRLFLRGSAKFESRAVHETLVCSGKTSLLAGDIHHHAYPTLEIYLEHMNRYSSLSAEMAYQQGRRSSLLLDTLLRPFSTFMYNYVFRVGFLDGAEGFLLNLYHAVYVSWKYAKLWRLKDS